VEQRNSQFRLELPDLLAERGLAQMEPFGGLAEVQGVGHGHDVPQMTEFHAVESLARLRAPRAILFGIRDGLISRTSQSQRNIYF
jgi:hypothetical protein